MNTLRKNIMRRIYYAYTVRLVTHRYTVHMALAAVALYAFAQLVFVASVINNLLAVEVGQLPRYVVGVVRDADVLTLLTFAVLVAVGVSLIRSVLRYDVGSQRQGFQVA